MSFPRFNSPSKQSLRRLCPYLTIALLVWLLPPFSSVQAQNAKRSARHEFNLARQYFERGRLQESVKVLKRLLKKYPNNKAAYHLLGRIYYRGGRVKAAAKFFNKTDGEFLFTGGGFEYGIAMFSVGRCAKAMDGFKRVPSNSTYKDLALFYSGVCHFRARRWYPAESELLRARRLPTNLVATRQRFLQEIQRKKQEERLGQFAQATPYQPVPIPYAGQPNFSAPANVPGLPAGPGAPTAEELKDPELDEDKKVAKSEPEPPQIRTGLSWNVTPLIEYKNISETYQRHQASTKTIATTGPRAEGNFQTRYDFSPDTHGRQIAAMGNLKFNYQQFEVSEKDVAVEINTDGNKTETATGGDSSDRNISFEFKPALSVPFGESLTLEGGGIYKETWPDVESNKKSVNMGPFGNINLTVFTLNLSVAGDLMQKEMLNDDNEVIFAQDTNVSLGINGPIPFFDLSFNLGASFAQTDNPTDFGSLDGFETSQSYTGGLTKSWETFSIGLTVTQTINTPPTDTVVSGTADELKAVAEVSKTLKIGATIKLSGEFAQINQYNKAGLCPADKDGFFNPDCEEDEQKTASAIGERTGFGVSLKFAPVDWAYASAAYEYDATTFNVQQKEVISAFQAAVADQVETITLLIGLSHTF